MTSSTLQDKAEILREKLYGFWAAKLGDPAPNEEQDDARACELISDWARAELGVGVTANPEVRHLTRDQYSRLRTAYEEWVIADCPELGCSDVAFYIQGFAIELMSPEALRAEKARVAAFEDPDPNYLAMLDERLAGKTVCEIPDEVWRVLD